MTKDEKDKLIKWAERKVSFILSKDDGLKDPYASEARCEINGAIQALRIILPDKECEEIEIIFDELLR